MDWSQAPKPPPEPEKPLAVCRIELTTEQRRVVKAQTGRDLHFIEVSDERGDLARSMRESHPDDVTRMALRSAEIQNERDAAQQAYVEELAAWQDAQQQEQPVDAAEAAAETDVEQRQLEIAAFYAAEPEAMDRAREAAVEAWDPDGKKRKKLAKQQQQ